MNVFTPSDRGGLYAKLQERGYIIEEVKIADRTTVKAKSPSGSIWVTGLKVSYPMNNHHIHNIADNKRASYEFASKLGMQVPSSIYVSEGAERVELQAFLDQFSPVIVKPLDSYKSRGVTLAIGSISELNQALDHAYIESSTAIVQQQVEGEEYRFTVLEGDVVSVLRRERPQIVGDGISTIRQLVAQENSSRRQFASKVKYPEWTRELIGSAVDDEEVLPEGGVRVLSGTTLVSKGASVYELIDQVDVSYTKLAERFARELGAGIVAIDMFIVDHAKEAAPGRYWFNECNVSPSFKMYSVARNANNEWIADKVVELTDKYLNIIDKVV